MNPSHQLKLNQGLLARTALLGLGAIVTGGLSRPIAAIGSNFSYGLITNNLGTLLDKFGNSGSILRNQDIAKAAGRAVAKTLEEEVSPTTPTFNHDA